MLPSRLTNLSQSNVKEAHANVTCPTCKTAGRNCRSELSLEKPIGRLPDAHFERAASSRRRPPSFSVRSSISAQETGAFHGIGGAETKYSPGGDHLSSPDDSRVGRSDRVDDEPGR